MAVTASRPWWAAALPWQALRRGVLERLAAATPWADLAWGAGLRRGHLGAVPGHSGSHGGVAGPQLDLDWRGLLAMDAAPAAAWGSHADSGT